MYFVSPPTRDDLWDYTSISAGRKLPSVRRSLAAKTSFIDVAYRQYEDLTPNVHTLTPLQFDDDVRDAMRENFRTLDTGRSFAYIRIELMGRTRHGRCPMCGRGQASSIDHYLPKSRYPEFAVFSKNLVPVCYDCNHKKGDAVGTSGSGRFLHAYYDVVPSEEILIATVEVEDMVFVRYHIARPPLVNGELIRNIEYQFDALDLGSAYQAEAYPEMMDRFGALSTVYGDQEDAAAVESMLTRETQSLLLSRGVNDWKTALYRAMARSKDFCDGGFKLLGDVYDF